MRSRLPSKRWVFARRRSDNPDVALLQIELERTERQLYEARLLVEKLRGDMEEKAGEAYSNALRSFFDPRSFVRVRSSANFRMAIAGLSEGAHCLKG